MSIGSIRISSFEKFKLRFLEHNNSNTVKRKTINKEIDDQPK